MADVTFVRGYGFPRGGSMDYAGLGTYERRGGVGADGCPIDTVRVGRRCVPFSQLNGYSGAGCGGGCGGSCGCGTPPRGLGRFGRAMSHDAGLFATIPALDGYGDEEATFEPEEITPGDMYGPGDPTAEQWRAMKGGSGLATGLGLLALGAALFLKFKW